MDGFRSVGTTFCPAIAAARRITLGSFVVSICGISAATSMGPRGHFCADACVAHRSESAIAIAASKAAGRAFMLDSPLPLERIEAHSLHGTLALCRQAVAGRRSAKSGGTF